MDSFGHFFSLLTAHGYVFMFILMLFEGPTITAASAFAAALGYFNINIVILIAIFGNLIPDIVFYSIGYWGRESFVKKNGKFLGFKKVNITALEKVFQENMVKGLFAAKLIPLLSIPGLVTAGVARIPFKKYLGWVSLIIACNSTFFLIFGYYFGATYKSFSQHFNTKIYLIIAFVLIFIVIIYAYRTILKKVVENVEEVKQSKKKKDK
jgi:membrane protein DedA with SNARE-associated domain